MFNSMDTECSYVHTETRTRTRNPVLDFSNPKTRVWKNGPGFGNPNYYNQSTGGEGAELSCGGAKY